MRMVARGAFGDVPVVGGESGVAGLARLLGLCAEPDLATQWGIDATARVLVINTEGATAPSVYEELVEMPVDEVRALQAVYRGLSKG